MRRTVLSCSLFLALCGPAFAQEGAHPDNFFSALGEGQIAHWAITLIGMAAAARWALLAFGRAVPVGDVPTVPRYMTGRQQYWFGGAIFALFACGFFLLLLHEHRPVIQLATMWKLLPEEVAKAVDDRSAPYLIVISIMGLVYIYLLTKEAPWNVLLMMRDVIQSWISVPQLAKGIMAQIKLSLRVPVNLIPDVLADSREVAEQDFRKGASTPDRLWAETCYMKWWLTQGEGVGEDAIFFTEDSFGYEKLLDEFAEMSEAMTRWKSGTTAETEKSKLPAKVKDLHCRFCRLAACYMIYRNGSRKQLCEEARKFGIELLTPVAENPFRYWIVYAIALMISVYVGVQVSAIGYDLLTTGGVSADPTNRALAWVMYSLSNYGLAIVAVLALRYLMSSLGSDATQSHLVTYGWTFVVALLVGPMGLAVAVLLFGAGPISQMPIYQIYFSVLKWGLGPGLVSVYISYYLDRQTYQDLPNIDHSFRTVGWRLINCLGFATATIFVLLPSLLALQAQADPDSGWTSAKLRVVATGSMFCLAFGLALAAQFGLRKNVPHPATTLLPVPS